MSFQRRYPSAFRDAILVTCTNLFTSVFAGLVIFSILGFLAEEMRLPISEVVQSAEGLAFIAYPEAVVRMGWPNLWAILFFVMLFILGLGSQVNTRAIRALYTHIVRFLTLRASVCAAANNERERKILSHGHLRRL